jgi:hypothetical protein
MNGLTRGWLSTLVRICSAPLLALSAACSATPCLLCEAIVSGDEAAVRARLAAGDSVTMTALRLAVDQTTILSRLGMAELGDTERAIADAVVQQADVNGRWSELTTDRRSARSSRMYMYAAAAAVQTWGDSAMLGLLLQRGLDVRGVPGGEALVMAAREGRADAVRLLLAAGAPVNHTGISVPTTALAEAIQRRDLAMIDRLEAAGALEWTPRSETPVGDARTAPAGGL